MKRFMTITLLLILPIWVSSSILAADVSELKSAVVKDVDGLSSEIDAISERLWDYSEIALKEGRSVEYLTRLLKHSGFEVETGVAEMETAFVAVYGSGSPVIGILAEFDALPGVGNAIVPERSPRTDGVTSGQGCGHNLFAAASIGGAIALKQIIDEHKLEGTIKLFGTPAEETVVGKVYMAKAGAFDGLDAVIDWHPATDTEVRNQPGRAMNNFEVEYFGQAAHGAADPWNGRSALDAVELLNHGVNLMREHVKPTTRIHYVIPSAGDAPNVVPEYAKVWYYVRAVNREEVQEYYEWILKIAEGAALATQTTHKVQLLTGVHEYLMNRPLQEALKANLDWIGPVPFDDADQEFAKKLQRYLGVEEKGFTAEIKPLAEGVEPTSGGSTDAAEVSYLAPTAAFSMTTAAAGIPWHSWATTACHGTKAARKAAVVAAKVIAATGVDLLVDEQLVKAAKEFHKEATGGVPYQSPVPQHQKPPLPNK
jgi:aminobenzoyl-glutamate utilization protein B